MIFSRLVYVEGREAHHEVVSKEANLDKLTLDCWFVQVWGLKACERCELKGKPDCGGKKILKKIEKGRFPRYGIGRPVIAGD
jgi:hypothetical protein